MEKQTGPLRTLFEWGTDIFSMMFGALGNPLKCVMQWFNGKATSVLCGAKSAAKKIVICIILSVVVLWVSVLLYASFYHMFVPTATIVRPAHFKFRVCPNGIGMCSFPMANITLGAENKAEVLGRGQQYLIVLEMQLPDSIPNRDVGMFMVMIRMYDRYGVITQESSRAVSLRYQSDLLKLIQTVALSPLYITGFSEEVQNLNIDMFGNFWDDYYRPSVGALVEIHSRHLVFYSARLHFHASYSGLKYYLFHYPLSCAFFGILFNCVWLTPAVLIPWYSFGLGLLNGKSPSDANNQEAEAERIGPQTGDAGNDARRRDSEDGADFDELKTDVTEVETVSRYVVQPFSVISLGASSSPSIDVGDDQPLALASEASEDSGRSRIKDDNAIVEGDSLLRQRPVCGTPKS